MDKPLARLAKKTRRKTQVKLELKEETWRLMPIYDKMEDLEGITLSEIGQVEKYKNCMI